jgi:hypothetical protein
LLRAFMRHVPKWRWSRYLRLLAARKKRPWLKAVAFDEFLVDVFLDQVRTTRPHFASLFLNAAAHIQHHYLFNAAVYPGPQRNPSWYVAPGLDPILDVYAAYDRALWRIMSQNPDSRVVIATGLHQDPHADGTYYWRLKDHEQFIARAGVVVREVCGLMSRDFVIRCSDPSQARRAQETLEAARIAADESPIFQCDNRGTSIFCTLVYGKSIPPGTLIHINDRVIDFRDAVAFVAIKNGEHNGLGYVLDTQAGSTEEKIKLGEIFSVIQEHFAASLVAS